MFRTGYLTTYYYQYYKNGIQENKSPITLETSSQCIIVYVTLFRLEDFNFLAQIKSIQISSNYQYQYLREFLWYDHLGSTAIGSQVQSNYYPNSSTMKCTILHMGTEDIILRLVYWGQQFQILEGIIFVWIFLSFDIRLSAPLQNIALCYAGSYIKSHILYQLSITASKWHPRDPSGFSSKILLHEPRQSQVCYPPPACDGQMSPSTPNLYILFR